MDLDVVGEDRYNMDVVYGQVKADFEPIKDLVFTGMASLNGSWDRRKIHYKNYKYYNEAGELVTQRNNPNSVKDSRNNSYQMTLRFLANYKSVSATTMIWRCSTVWSKSLTATIIQWLSVKI